MSAQTQPVSSKSANQALGAELRSSRDEFLAVLDSVPEALAKVRPTEESWSVLECAEHVVLAEMGMFGALQKRRPTDAAPDLSRDTLVEQIALNRSQRLDAPARVVPTGRYNTLAEAGEAFRAAREQTIAFVEGLDEDLRMSTCAHPFGIFDSYQYVRIMALHCKRHAQQIEETRRIL